MYPDLSYLFHDLFGTPVDNWLSIFKTFGLLLATALFSTWVLLRSELKRLESKNLLQPRTITETVTAGVEWKEILYNGLIVGLLGMKVPYIMQHFPEFQGDPASVIFSGKGNLLIGLLGAAAVMVLTYFSHTKRDKKPGTYTRQEFPHEKAGDIVILAGVSGVFGAKLFSIFENIPAFLADPAGQLFSGNGLNILGGLIVAFFVVYMYVRGLTTSLKM